MNFLAGKRTYIVAAIAGIVAIVYSLGYINQEQLTMIQSFLAALGLTTIRLAIGNGK